MIGSVIIQKQIDNFIWIVGYSEVMVDFDDETEYHEGNEDYWRVKWNEETKEQKRKRKWKIKQKY